MRDFLSGLLFNEPYTSKGHKGSWRRCGTCVEIQRKGRERLKRYNDFKRETRRAFRPYKKFGGSVARGVDREFRSIGRGVGSGLLDIILPTPRRRW